MRDYRLKIDPRAGISPLFILDLMILNISDLFKIIKINIEIFLNSIKQSRYFSLLCYLSMTGMPSVCGESPRRA